MPKKPLLLCAIVSGLFIADLPAVTFLIDMGTNEATALPPSTWNSRNRSTANILSSVNLNDSVGNLTGVSFIGAGTINTGTAGTGTFNNATVPSGLAWAATTIATTNFNGASGDWLYTSNSGTGTPAQRNFSYVLTFDGLTAGNVFSLDVLSSRNTADSVGFYEYSLNDGTTWIGFTVLNGDGSDAGLVDTQTTAFNSQTQGYTAKQYMNASGITLTGSTLLVRARDNEANPAHYAGINAMRLTVVPEPSSAALFLGGLSAFFLKRRR